MCSVFFFYENTYILVELGINLTFVLLKLLCFVQNVREKESTLFERLFNVFRTKVLISDTNFYVSNGDRTTVIRGHLSHTKVRTKEVPSIFSYFKTLRIKRSPVQGIEPATSRSAVKRSTD